MSQAWTLPWCVDFWADDVAAAYGLRTPPGWPTALPNAEADTGYPAIGPVTVDQAAQFDGRMQQATIDLQLSFAGGADTWSETLTMKRFTQPNGLGVEIVAGDERLYLTPQFSIGAGEYAPSYFGQGTRTVDIDNSITWTIEIFTQFLWFDYARDIAFFNLSVRLDVSATINGHEYLFNATQTQVTASDQGGDITLFGASLTLYGTDMGTPYSFSLLNFTGVLFYPYAKNDGSEPIYDTATGAEIGDHETVPEL